MAASFACAFIQPRRALFDRFSAGNSLLFHTSGSLSKTCCFSFGSRAEIINPERIPVPAPNALPGIRLKKEEIAPGSRTVACSTKADPDPSKPSTDR
jgi:hypothetical protein